MNVLVRLLTFYELARRKLKQPIGEIFPYIGTATGLQMLAEFIARICLDGIAVMIFPAHGTENLVFIPSGISNSGFKIDQKVGLLQQELYFVVVMQREERLSSGNYIALKMPYNGDNIDLYHIRDRNNQPIFISSFNLAYLDSHAEILQRAFQLVLSEVDTVME